MAVEAVMTGGAAAPLEARRLLIRGIVQGVGFRPFVYQLARRLGLAGEVANTSEGVVVHLEGQTAALDAFEAALECEAPPLARVTGIETRPAEVRRLDDFRIQTSRRGVSRATLISPDMAVCDRCLAELFDPADRRFGYPFINCTHCGPRYTIIDDVPYDRPHTSMRRFTMCPACQAEYDDPADRRFHAQPNACPVCGPQVTLCTADGQPVTAADPIAEAAARLGSGRIAAIKGLGGFHLAVDALNPEAVARLRRRKRREEKPFALMVPDLAAARRLVVLDPAAEALLVSPRRPIVIAPRRPGNPVAPLVAPRNGYFGILLPYTPLHHLLLRQGFEALVMTSGNISDEPICIDNAEALARLGGIADDFLIHDRDIYLRSDDSIVRPAAGATRFIRRSRGYVPEPIALRDPLPPVLACGAGLKNTVCLTRGAEAFVSQHIGDLENLAAYRFLQKTVAHLERILDVRPRIVAHDLHPDYLSTRYALSRAGVRRIAVQHHHAHIVSVMAEHGLDGPVIGLALDGTGYGADGAVWGGEVLVTRAGGFTRAAHLAYVPMPGGAAAIREPWRMAAAHLEDAFGDGWQRLDLPLFAATPVAKLDLAARMARSGVNAPPTSSLGRLFDAVAALCGLNAQVRYEGQAAMELEMAADPQAPGRYPYEVAPGAVLTVRTAPMIRAVAADLGAGVPVSVVAGRFHRTVIDLFVNLCRQVRQRTGLDQVALSGGVFQNVIVLEGMIRALADAGFQVYTPEQVPANDGGISLGQAVAAAAMAEGSMR
ncbi:MAG: carbamoyltransferase HypF [Desulfobacteraceae bacterium]|jgi:hydrogenase maturation protein HypF|nr:carbamoyltransferase HypF [Desulfobacteraceae bacterium]